MPRNQPCFDGRSYTAKLLGSDPLTDLALLKIDEKNLSFIPFNGDTIEIGEWVVAEIRLIWHLRSQEL
jgi:S1-C subfamily serine protease